MKEPETKVEAKKLGEEDLIKVIKSDGAKRPKFDEQRIRELNRKLGRSPSDKELKEPKVSRAVQLEKFIVEFSNSALNIIRKEGKNLRDLFNIFSKEVNGFLNQSEFSSACQFIMN